MNPKQFIRVGLSFLFSLHNPALARKIPRNDDMVQRDNDPQNGQAITFTYVPVERGYVAFGDSYAAGIGTGTTEGSGCRQGQYSYPKQIRSLIQDERAFQNLPCSGAVVSEVLEGDKSQIDSWTNPENFDFASLSIGGNDIGFYNILTACVLRVGQGRAGNCDDEIRKAYAKINGRDLTNDVQSALNQILDKAGKADFKIVQTGYPSFFNDVTTYCDYSTFYFWAPGHHGIHHGGNWAYLYTDLRAKLNKLVEDLNAMLSSAVDGVNRSRPKQQVWFVDPNPRYYGHRFCEQGVDDPDAARDDTWLFLSGWQDNSLRSTTSAWTSVVQIVEEEAAWTDSSVRIPDAVTCNGSKDWYDQILCEISAADLISDNGAGGVQLSSNISTSEIGFLIPTRSAKTFYPKTLGHKAYADLVLELWGTDGYFP